MAAFTADYMKAVKSRSVAGGVGPRLLNRQSLNLRDARAARQERKVRLNRAAGGRPKNPEKDLQHGFCMSDLPYLVSAAMHMMCFLKATLQLCALLNVQRKLQMIRYSAAAAPL